MRTITFLIFILIFLGSIWFTLANQNNIIIIELLNYHIEISLILATVLLLVSSISIFYIFYFLIFLKRIPNSLKKYYQEKHEHQDINLLLEGFTSLFNDDVDENKQLLKKLIKHKDDSSLKALQPIISLLISQSYQHQYQQDKNYNEQLEDSYINLLLHENMKPIALKGLIKIRMEKKRYYDALIYAEKALTLNPKLEWLIKDLIKIYSELGIYEKADLIIHKALNYKFLKKEEANSLFISNFLAHANYAIANSNVELAIDLIEKALKIDPTNYDAIFTLVGIENDDLKTIYKVIEKAWKIKPSIELAKLLANKSKTLPLNKRVKLLTNLIDSNTNAKEGYQILAELYIDEKMLEDAKKIMEQFLELHAPDFRTIKLMALIEAKSHSNHNLIISWLNKL